MVLVTALEHHSNFVPGSTSQANRSDDQGDSRLTITRELRLDTLDEFAPDRATSRSSRTTSSRTHSGRSTRRAPRRPWAHEQGAIMVVDAAQAAPHHAIDVQELGCDFLAFSSHKMCGPTSVGALWGRAELLEAMSPFNLGGHMIRSVKLEETTWGPDPVQVRGRHAADRRGGRLRRRVDYLTDIGIGAIEEHERELLVYALEKLAEVPGLTAYGPPPERRPGSSPSTSTACTRTTSRRSSTWTAWRSAPDTTAASR
jgi:cysteine desulfurase/selenocysteine lyase